MNFEAKFAELEKILAVVAGVGIVVGGRRQGEVSLRGALRRRVLGQNDERAEQAHFHLQIGPRAAVVAVRSGLGRRKRVSYRRVRRGFLRQQSSHAAAGAYVKSGEQDRCIAGRSGQVVRQIHRDHVAFGDDQRWARHLHLRAGVVLRGEGLKAEGRPTRIHIPTSKSTCRQAG